MGRFLQYHYGFGQDEIDEVEQCVSSINPRFTIGDNIEHCTPILLEYGMSPTAAKIFLKWVFDVREPELNMPTQF
jgi:hypothetical protein